MPDRHPTPARALKAVATLAVACILAYVAARALVAAPSWVRTVTPYLIVWAGLLAPLIWVRPQWRTPTRDGGVGSIFRPIDLVYALALGLALRAFAQVTGAAVNGPQSLWPTVARFDGKLPELFWFTAVVAAVLVAPLLEEVVFRGIVLPGLARFGTVTGLLGSALLFAAFHVLQSSGPGAMLIAAVSSTAVGVVCAALTLTTGRLAGAIGVHVVYNASWVVAALL